MPRKSIAQRINPARSRVQLSFMLSKEDNDLVRDYRFTQIMTTQNTELSLSDVIDDVFAAFREYLEKPTVIIPREDISGKRDYRAVFYLRQEDTDLLKEFRLKKILSTQNVNFNMTAAMGQILDVFRHTLKQRGYELMSRPDIVRAAESQISRKNKKVQSSEDPGSR